MGKTPGKWIKTLLLGKKSPKLNLADGSRTLESAKKDEVVVPVRDDFSNLSISSQPAPATTTTTTAQNVVAPDNGDESSVNLELSNDVKEAELQQAAVKVQATFRAHQARRAFRTLKGIIRLQAVIRGHLVRRQAVATYSCIWGIVKFQALVRGQRARSSENGIQFQKKYAEADDSEALQLSTYSWMNNPTKVLIVDKFLASSPTALPLKIQYGPEDPNSAKIWLERWTQLQVWSPGSRAARIQVPKSNTRKRNYQAVAETEKVRPKRGVKKQSGANGSNRSTTESEKLKRNVRKVSRVSKDPLKTDIDKTKRNSSKSRSTSKKISPLEVKDEKLGKSNLKRSSLSNGSQRATRKSAEKKKDIGDSVQIEPEVKVSDVLKGDVVESAEKKKDTTDAAPGEFHVEKEENSPEEVKVSDVSIGGDVAESAEKKKDITDAAPEEFHVEKEENSPEDVEPRTVETNDKGQDLECSDVKANSDNVNVGSDNKPSQRRVSLSPNIDNQEDGVTHSGRRIPSYMAPTASAKARLKGEESPRFSLEKTEKNGALRRHSLPSPANGKLSTTTMSPTAHKILLASAKGNTNGNDKSFTSSRDTGDKSTRTKWKR